MTRELLHGLTRFQTQQFPQLEDRYRRLVAEGQSPDTLFIACSDSRVLPDLFTDAGPGDLFTVRNVGNVVPPFDPEGRQDGVPAAIAYAVEILEVRDIVVCGHSHCGAVRALYEPPADETGQLTRWLELAREAKLDDDPSEPVLRRTEERSVVLQLDRLMEYPAVRSRVKSGALALHGWHYILEEGEVRILDPDTGTFEAHGDA